MLQMPLLSVAPFAYHACACFLPDSFSAEISSHFVSLASAAPLMHFCLSFSVSCMLFDNVSCLQAASASSCKEFIA
jgi:hypothetical protein